MHCRFNELDQATKAEIIKTELSHHEYISDEALRKRMLHAFQKEQELGLDVWSRYGYLVYKKLKRDPSPVCDERLATYSVRDGQRVRVLAIVNDEDVVFEGKALGVGLDSDITLRNFQIPMDALHIELDEHNYHVKKSPLDELLIPQSAYRIYLGYEIDDIFILEDESQE